MITAGIDMGAKTIKVVIIKDGKIITQQIIPSGFDQRAAAEKAFAQALADAKVSANEINGIAATGMGRKEVYMHPPISANKEVTEVTASARGAAYLFPTAKTVIDVGAEEGRAIRCETSGKVIDFAVNEKCAAGAGAFTEAMARALEIPLEKMGELSMQSDQVVPMNAQCAVFAESEVVSLIHAKTSKPNIARSVHDAIASRIVSMARRVGIENDIVLVGGLSRNKGFVKSLQDALGNTVLIPQEPEFAGAIGAALVAGE
jgi:benzoyl-CoA reductase subunit D